MTFLCGHDQRAGVPWEANDWPAPWWLRCNGCGATDTYDAARALPLGIAQTGDDEHHCLACRRSARTGQLELAVGA